MIAFTDYKGDLFSLASYAVSESKCSQKYRDITYKNASQNRPTKKPPTPLGSQKNYLLFFQVQHKRCFWIKNRQSQPDLF
jgi:hypothetical protein